MSCLNRLFGKTKYKYRHINTRDNVEKSVQFLYKQKKKKIFKALQRLLHIENIIFPSNISCKAMFCSNNKKYICVQYMQMSHHLFEYKNVNTKTLTLKGVDLQMSERKILTDVEIWETSIQFTCFKQEYHEGIRCSLIA